MVSKDMMNESKHMNQSGCQHTGGGEHTEHADCAQRGVGKISLAIELSNPHATPGAHHAALFGGGSNGLIGSMAIPDGMRSADGLMMLIDRLCKAHRVMPGEIGRLLVSVGPGGYTSLRIATTTAKVLADTLGCELIAVPTPSVVAAGYRHQCDDSEIRYPALIALASKKQLAHCSMLGADGSVEELGVIGADALVDFNVSALISDDHVPSSFVEHAQLRRWALVPMDIDARWCMSASAGIEPIAPIELMPTYAREPDAITQWRARHGSPASE